MRKLLFLAGLCVAGSGGLGLKAGHAQDFPNKPIRIVTSGIGGSADFASRVIAHGLTAALGQQVIVDNRPNGPIPGEIVARAAPDGYTLLVSANSLWMGKLLQAAISYDPMKDFTPVTLATTSPNVLLVPPALPVHSVKDLIALAKTRPGQLNYGSGAAGASSHLAAELLKAMAGINLVRIPYKSNASQIADLIGGQIQLMFSNATAAPPHIKSGRLRALAVTTPQPSALFPELPTVAATVPGYESAVINGVLAPARMPAPLIMRLNQEIVRAINAPDARARLAPAGVEAVGSTPETLAGIIKTEVAKWSKIIKETGMRAQE